MKEYILIQYIEGKLPEDQAKEVESWIEQSEENKATVENIYSLHIIDKSIKNINNVNTDKKYNEFMSDWVTQSDSHKTAKRRSLVQISKVAAIGIILLATTFFSALLFISESTAPIKISTQLGERSHVTLPDGTEVWLNAFSELEFKKSLLSRKRKAHLTGEAYFDVAHNKTLPFVVTTDETSIRVLGTKFNLRNNIDEEYVQASLIEGSIQFSNNHTKRKPILEPNEELRYNKKTYATTIRRIHNMDDEISWREGYLRFNDCSLDEICKTLERNFNIKIHFAEEHLKEKRFTAEFEVADNIYQILSALELTNKFKLKIDNRNITILPKDK